MTKKTDENPAADNPDVFDPKVAEAARASREESRKTLAAEIRKEIDELIAQLNALDPAIKSEVLPPGEAHRLHLLEREVITRERGQDQHERDEKAYEERWRQHYHHNLLTRVTIALIEKQSAFMEPSDQIAWARRYADAAYGK